MMRPQRDVFALACIEETIAAYKQATANTKGEASEKICWRIAPAKTFEHIGMQKPILGLLPSGDPKGFVTTCCWGRVVPPNDAQKIR